MPSWTRARIIYVNQAWARFAAANAGPETNSYVSAGYLSVCEEAACHGDQAAAMACGGLRAVMNGTRSDFMLPYPYDSPADKRGFVMRVTRYAAEPTVSIVVSHQNITASKKAEEALHHANAALEAANRGLDMALDREHRLARTDRLTGRGNRRHLCHHATWEFAEPKRCGRPLSVVRFDIDHFKKVNDTARHQTGDEMLKCVAPMAGQHLREVDILARYGGEEFVVLLPNSNAADAVCVAERIRKNVAAMYPVTDPPSISVTISAGGAQCPGDAEPLDPLIRCADCALYEAKRGGRDHAIIFSPRNR